jgi:hypothetical protein
MVERIIAASSQKLEAGGEFFVAWGIASALMFLLMQLIEDGHLPLWGLWATLPILGAAVVFSAMRQRCYRRAGFERLSLLQREFFNVLSLTLAMAFVVNVIGFHVFARWGGPALWSVAGSIVLFYIGMHGNRRAIVGGIIMLASIAIANFMPAIAGYALGGGMLLGYAGFGVADLLAAE